MKLVRVLFAGALCTLSLFGADFTGTWVGVVKPGAPPAGAPPANNAGRAGGNNGGRGNNAGPLPFIVHIKQDGDTITGKMDGIGGAPDVEIVNGKVNGNVITYDGIRQINNQDVKFNYIGTLNGDVLDFQILRAAGGNPLASSTTRLTPAF